MTSNVGQRGKNILALPLSFSLMSIDDLEEVGEIEKRVYSQPWTYGNFYDSIKSGYQCWTLRDASYRLVGYFFIMSVVDEAHLLNISVHVDLNGRGLGKNLLDKVVTLARDNTMESVLLEVRPSNQRAITIYQRYGFVQIGIRPGYYPTAGECREDAIVMRLSL
ncbi:MAG: ribosomal protein S18-alanine N-acetyltransferase [Glaciimonas sp.]|nr:ribosomal protein S18-alanine N-acetyltransferase [Glaciimonas sp.]